MAYDGVYALKQGIEKAGSTDTEKVKDAMKGMAVNTTREKLFFRKTDNQLSCLAYFGRRRITGVMKKRLGLQGPSRKWYGNARSPFL